MKKDNSQIFFKNPCPRHTTPGVSAGAGQVETEKREIPEHTEAGLTAGLIAVPWCALEFLFFWSAKDVWHVWIDGNCSSRFSLLVQLKKMLLETVICSRWRLDTFITMIKQNLLHRYISVIFLKLALFSRPGSSMGSLPVACRLGEAFSSKNHNNLNQRLLSASFYYFSNIILILRFLFFALPPI